MKKFDYNDINLIPRYSTVNSRSECDTTIKFGKHTFKNPVIPANMESVINEELAVDLAKNGYFYIMHRFDVDSVEFTLKMKNMGLISSISIGVNEESYQTVDRFVELAIAPDYVCIDIAHGHSKKLKHMIKYLREKLPESFIIAGNVSTREAVEDLTEWGAGAIKIGIGPGSACTTYPITGFGSRNTQAGTVKHCAKKSRVPIIADGGIKLPSDIAKSIVLGADMVMVGGMLSSFIDSPGKTVEKDGKLFKQFHGSASSHQSGKSARIEGTLTHNELKNTTLVDYMGYLSECLQSSISYGGGDKLVDLKSVKYIK